MTGTPLGTRCAEVIPDDVLAVTDKDTPADTWRRIAPGLGLATRWRSDADPGTTMTTGQLMLEFGPVTVARVAVPAAQGARDMSEAARIMWEIAQNPPPGPWTTWLNDKTGTWSVRTRGAGRTHPHLAYEAEGQRIAGYLAALPPQVMMAMAEALRGAARRLALPGMDWWIHDYPLHDVATAFLKGITGDTEGRG